MNKDGATQSQTEFGKMVGAEGLEPTILPL